MSLQKAITHWDGKSSDCISEIYKGYVHESTFVRQLVMALHEPSLQRGATWLIKRHLEENAVIPQKQIKQIYGLLPRLDHWEAKLHLLQSIPFMPIATAEKTAVESFVRECIASKNKFVRAWAYNGFHQLASQYSEYQTEASQLLERALTEEAASVKARIRNILKS